MSLNSGIFKSEASQQSGDDICDHARFKLFSIGITSGVMQIPTGFSELHAMTGVWLAYVCWSARP